jgi:hypothetical protein
MYGESNGKLCARIDIKRANQADDLNLHDEATIVIKGKVKRLEGPEEYVGMEYKNGKEKEVDRQRPGVIELEITSMKVAKDGKFDGMLD